MNASETSQLPILAKKGGVRVRSESSRVLSIYDIPEATAQQLLEILRNDLKEYESLDGDFGEGTESAIRTFVGELEKHFPAKK